MKKQVKAVSAKFYRVSYSFHLTMLYLRLNLQISSNTLSTNPSLKLISCHLRRFSINSLGLQP